MVKWISWNKIISIKTTTSRVNVFIETYTVICVYLQRFIPATSICYLVVCQQVQAILQAALAVPSSIENILSFTIVIQAADTVVTVSDTVAHSNSDSLIQFQAQPKLYAQLNNREDVAIIVALQPLNSDDRCLKLDTLQSKNNNPS